MNQTLRLAWILLAGCTLVGCGHRGQVKAATVVVRAVRTSGVIHASGFLLGRAGDRAYLLTSGIISEGPDIEVVFSSGTEAERVYPARFLDVEPNFSLALLSIQTKDALPPAPKLDFRTRMRRNDTVCVAGCTLASPISQARFHSGISLYPATVVGIVEGSEGPPYGFLIRGEGMGHGCVGGPVFSGADEVVGVFSLSSPIYSLERLRAFLQGRVKSIALVSTPRPGGGVMIRSELTLSDPLVSMESAAIAYIGYSTVEALEKEPKPGPDGSWGKAIPAMREAALEISADHMKAFALLEGERDTHAPLSGYLYVQCHYTRRDGSTVWMPPQAVELSSK